MTLRIGLMVDSVLNQYGNGRYARDLLQYISWNQQALAIEWTLIHYRDHPVQPIVQQLRLNPAFAYRYHAIRSKRISRYTNLFLPLLAHEPLPPLDILHALRPTEILAHPPKATQQVATLLDLGTRRTGLKNWRLRLTDAANERLLQKVRHVFTISQQVRTEAIELLQQKPENITAIPLGLQERFFVLVEDAQVKRVREKYQLPECYIVTAGLIHPRKNIAALVRAYIAAITQTSMLPDLLLMGAGGNDIVKKIEQENLINISRIHPIGFVDDEDIPAVLQNAQWYISVSQYEGFGYPPLEAQALGTPVIASDIPVYRETLADTALYCDPYRPEDIVRVLVQSVALSSDAYAKLRQEAKINARRFQMSRVIDKYLELYQHLYI